MNKLKTFPGLGIAAVGGALALGACTTNTSPAASPSQKDQSQSAKQSDIFASRGPAKQHSPNCSNHPYINVPADPMDLLIICQATRAAARAFIELEQSIAATKGCSVIQAINRQGDQIMEACMPMVTISASPNSDMGKAIASIRKGLVIVQSGMHALQTTNAHCFEPTQEVPDITPKPGTKPPQPRQETTPGLSASLE